MFVMLPRDGLTQIIPDIGLVLVCHLWVVSALQRYELLIRNAHQNNSEHI